MPCPSVRQPEKRHVTSAPSDGHSAGTTTPLTFTRLQRIHGLVCCRMPRCYVPLLARRISALAGLLFSVGASSAFAQCRPPRDSHEARLLAFYSVPVVFSADVASLTLSPGALRLSGEAAFVPTPSTTLQHTDYCYTGRAENTSLTSFFGRPRLAVGLPMGFGIEVSYLPSITVANATPNLASAGLWLTRKMTTALLLMGRVHGTIGTVRGPITCPRTALQQQDAQAPCYGTSPSVDEFRPNMAGAELILATIPRNTSRVRFSAGLGVNRLYPRFRVGFSDLSGGTDRTRITVDLTRVTALAGATVSLSHRCDASAQAFTSLSDATTVRATVGCLLVR
jgi:hypothetical protein